MMAVRYWKRCLLLLSLVCGIQPSGGDETAQAQLAVSQRPVLYVLTLNGDFYSLYQDSGEIKWKAEDDPVLSVSSARDMPHGSYFLPDPTDGSLYSLRGNGEPLEKMPFSIPDLVRASPCQSQDSTLYTGRKSDVFNVIDLDTGQYHQTLTASGTNAKCAMTSAQSLVYLGRSEYTISAFDSQTKERKWNATYLDYSVGHPIDYQPHFVPLMATSDGSMAVVNTISGRTLWRQDLSSPIMAVYVFSSNDGLLRPMPYRRVSKEVLVAAVETHSDLYQASALAGPDLMQVLFVGTQNGSMYAYNTWAQDAQLTLNQPTVPLISPQNTPSTGGSGGGGSKHGSGSADPTKTLSTSTEVLRVEPFRYVPVPRLSAFSALRPRSNVHLPSVHDSPWTRAGDPVQPQLRANERFRNNGGNVLHTSQATHHYDASHNHVVDVDANKENINKHKHNNTFNDISIANSLLMVVLAFLVAVFVGFLFSITKTVESVSSRWLLGRVTTPATAGNRHRTNLSAQSGNGGQATFASGTPQSSVASASQQHENGSHSSTSSQNESSRNGSVVDLSTASGDGGENDSLRSTMMIGKISFRPKDVIGHGSEGTRVFRGKFENREVAVKRVLREGYQLVMKEVELLRDGHADDHANVIRYYCTECNDTFYFIALELCQASLKDYVDNYEKFSVQISQRDVMKQMLSGLTYLHSLKIVHRDIKPQNVLISYPKYNGQVRALLSDFGLCKKLADGRQSFTARSGVTGTEGWIAPEIMSSQCSTATCSVDIFSAGCVIFCVLSKGSHPFGPALHRQMNISTDKAPDFGALDNCLSYDDVVLARDLVSSMISRYPAHRPEAPEALLHPVFWSRRRQMQFMQEVSDRIEKELATSPIVVRLEQNAPKVVTSDWRQVLGPELKEEMTRHRSYQGDSVRTLVRFIRNKKHHYHELSEPVRSKLGSLPEEFINYFTSRFPQLLLHTYKAMEMCNNETVFQDYYHVTNI